MCHWGLYKAKSACREKIVISKARELEKLNPMRFCNSVTRLGRLKTARHETCTYSCLGRIEYASNRALKKNIVTYKSACEESKKLWVVISTVENTIFAMKLST